MSLQSTAQAHLVQTYAQYGIELSKAKGSEVWDSTGKRYLDFYGGHAVCLLGHCPDQVVAAITEQASTLLFYSNIVQTAPAVELAELLTNTLQPETYKVYFSNSGSEANETALKIARKHTGKSHVISFTNSFHGRSITSIGVTGIHSYHNFQPNLDEHTSFATLGDMASVEAAIRPDTGAIICEPIQSIGSVTMADVQFYKNLEEFCNTHGLLLIFDEVQTGLGRTGTFWFSQSVGVQPDIITTAKGIASGLPLSAVLLKDHVADKVAVGDQATTFGGGPVVCAAGKATVETIVADGFLDDVQQKSAYLREQIEQIPGVQATRGLALLLGIEFEAPQPDLVKACLKQGLIIGGSMDKAVVRLLPPLTITEAEIDEFLQIFTNVVTSLHS